MASSLSWFDHHVLRGFIHRMAMNRSQAWKSTWTWSGMSDWFNNHRFHFWSFPCLLLTCHLARILNSSEDIIWLTDWLYFLTNLKDHDCFSVLSKVTIRSRSRHNIMNNSNSHNKTLYMTTTRWTTRCGLCLCSSHRPFVMEGEKASCGAPPPPAERSTLAVLWTHTHANTEQHEC